MSYDRKTQDNLRTALKLLIENAREIQDLSWPGFKMLSPKSWIKEYCVVRLGSTRRAGHTHASIHLPLAMAKKILHISRSSAAKRCAEVELLAAITGFKKQLVGTVDKFLADSLLQQMNEKFTFVHWGQRELMQDIGSLFGFDMVVIDGASMISDSALDLLYENYIAHHHGKLEQPHHLFILLQ